MTVQSAILRDGTPVEALLDDSRRAVAARVHSDADIFELEMANLFARAWIAVAHESELMRPGDFVHRYVGRDPIVITRDRAGELRGFLNVCAHRGMPVCRADSGNQQSFVCPYHGWTYDATGALRGVPAERDRYPAGVDRAQFSLRRARVESYAGWIFACWDEDAPDLQDYLGDMTYYMDLSWARTRDGFEVVGPPQRWMLRCNWKLAAEQFSGDGYHALMTHRSLQDAGYVTLGENLLTGIDVACDGAHVLRHADLREFAAQLDDCREIFNLMPPPAMSVDQLDELDTALPRDKVEFLASAPPVGGAVFPTFSWLSFRSPDAVGNMPSVVSPRVWMPRGPNRTEVMLWVLVERGASEEVRRETYETTIRNFSSSGVWEQDDAENWGGIQGVLAGHVAQQQWFDYSSRPASSATDWPAGEAFPGVNSDELIWRFYSRWREFVTGRAWSYLQDRHRAAVPSRV